MSGKTVDVFISSTFHDMHAERDLLVRRVFPFLREKAWQQGILVRDIDLRWGIADQAETERLLDLALTRLEQCLPFFVAVLGQRYGTPFLQLSAATLARHRWLQERHCGLSFTALEIERVIELQKSMDLRETAFFYQRDPGYLATLDWAERRAFEDDSGREREALVERIRAAGFQIRRYPCLWDPRRISPESGMRGRIVDLDIFERMVREDLAKSLKTVPRVSSSRPCEHSTDELAAGEGMGWQGVRNLDGKVYDEKECHQLLQARLRLMGKRLSQEQEEMLLRIPAIRDPFFLTVCMEELRQFGSYDKLTRRIEGLADASRHGKPLTGLFLQVIDRLVGDFDAEVVREILTGLRSARDGLTEEELKELVGARDLDRDLFAILRHLRAYLWTRQSAGEGLVVFAHAAFGEATDERWLSNPSERRAAHGRLAATFLRQPSRLDRGGSPNLRKSRELVWQLLQAENWQGVVTALTELALLEVKVETMPAVLEEELATAIARMPVEGNRTRRYILETLRAAITREREFLARHPGQFFQAVWDRCRWYDDPGAAAHYRIEAGISDGELPWQRKGLRMHHLLADWLTRKSANPGFCWIQCRRPPYPPMGWEERIAVKGHTAPIIDGQFDPAGRSVVTIGLDKSLRRWDVITGKELGATAIKVDQDRCLFHTPEGEVRIERPRRGGGASRLVRDEPLCRTALAAIGEAAVTSWTPGLKKLLRSPVHAGLFAGWKGAQLFLFSLERNSPL